MKKNYCITLLLCLSSSAFGQGQIYLDNNVNTSTSPLATHNGLFFFCSGTVPILANTDFNVSFYGGSDANNLVLLRTFSGPSAVGGNAFGPGTFTDPQGIAVTIPGAVNTAFFRIDAWTGSATDYNGGSGVFLRGSSGVFSNPVAGAPNPPPDFINMPAVIITYLEGCPEPGSVTLAGLGGIVLLTWRRLRRNRPGPGSAAFPGRK
jgi:hypothetical protein